jgi:hypothetical protein
MLIWALDNYVKSSAILRIGNRCSFLIHIGIATSGYFLFPVARGTSDAGKDLGRCGLGKWYQGQLLPTWPFLVA